MRITILQLQFFLFLTPFMAASQKNSKPEYYQISVYKFTKPSQEKILDQYFESTLLPALHKYKISNVGVFKAISNDTSVEKSLYVLFPVKSLKMLATTRQKIEDDKTYQSAGADFINASYNDPAYDRMEIILLKAFSLAPKMNFPKLKAPKNERVYELRSYQSPTEKKFKNKVQMFNEGGETKIFKYLNFNAIFYGEVIAGSKMPNLMYMTSFENKTDRDAHWKSFGSDPAWKKLSAMPEYKNNLSHIDITFLRPTDYSDY